MMRNVLILTVLVLLTSCQQSAPFEYHEDIAGIPHSLWIAGSDRQAATRASNAVFSELRLLSTFTHPVQSKPISRINVLLRSREWFSVNPSMTTILKQSVEYYRKTDGLFNPAAQGALRELWGAYDAAPPAAAPVEKDIESLLADLPTMEDVRFDGIRLRGDNPRLRLDFDWLAYGYAIDLQMEQLRELGIANARLKIGGVEMTLGDIAGGVSGQAVCHRTPTAPTDSIDTRTGHPVDNVTELTVFAKTASDAAVGCRVLLISNTGSRQRMVDQLQLIEARLTGRDGNTVILTPTT